jgi:hypothetical protein
LAGLLGTACLLTSQVSFADFSYTYLEFGSLAARSDFSAEQVAGPQTVTLDPDSGDGLMIAGSLAFGSRFYIRSSYRAATLDTDALVSSPLAVSVASGSFDWTTASAALGTAFSLSERLDLFAELGYRTVHFDFGSFAGENFDADDSGSEVAAGLRFSPNERVEFDLKAFSNSIGESNLATGEFANQPGFEAALRWYVFEDIGLGVELRSGDVRSFGASIRFGFGDLRAGN